MQKGVHKMYGWNEIRVDSYSSKTKLYCVCWHRNFVGVDAYSLRYIASDDEYDIDRCVLSTWSRMRR